MADAFLIQSVHLSQASTGGITEVNLQLGRIGNKSGNLTLSSPKCWFLCYLPCISTGWPLVYIYYVNVLWGTDHLQVIRNP